jgi:hypothetical protein
MATQEMETVMKREVIGAILIFAVIFGVMAIFAITNGVSASDWLFALLAATGITVVSIITARRRVSRQP